MNKETSNLNLILVPATDKKIACEGCFYYMNSPHECPDISTGCESNGIPKIWVKNPASNFFNNPTFPLGTYVEKIKGSEWEGKVVGFYSTSLTPRGYAVESSTHAGSVQIYPESALRRKEQDEDNPAR